MAIDKLNNIFWTPPVNRGQEEKNKKRKKDEKSKLKKKENRNDGSSKEPGKIDIRI